MGRAAVIAVVVCGVLGLTGPAASAQELSQILVNLTDILLAPSPLPGSNVSHQGHFTPQAVPGVNELPEVFNQQVITQLSTTPIGSSSGGFSFTFNPSLGTIERTTESFGPMFAERAFTNGKGRLTVGATFQYAKFTSFEGTSLDDGSIKFYLRHQDVGSFVQGDLVEEDLRLSLSSATTTVYANYGLMDRWDVSIAVPIEHVSMDATVNATILRLSTGAAPPPANLTHRFPDGSDRATYSQSGSASGLGDITLRTKYRFLSAPGGGLAAGLDVRLPSGDDRNLLGTGATQTTIALIGSATRGAVSPHFNVAFTGSHSMSGAVVEMPNELGYRFGAEFVVKPTVTLLADFVGRSLRNAGRLEFTDTTWRYQIGSNTGPFATQTLHEFASVPGSLNLSNVALGGKFNVAGNLLITANVLVAVTSSGLTARVIPAVGVDYSF